MRRAFLCDTAYQAFNMLLFYSQMGEPEETDFFLCDYFAYAKTLYRKLPEEYSFSGRVLFTPHEPMEGERKLHWYFRHASAYLSPGRSVRESIVEGTAALTGYDEIYASTITMFVSCILQRNPQAKLFMIDEGVGGYSSDPVSGNLSWRHRLFMAIFRRGAAVRIPECMYMYHTGNAARHTDIPLKEMPKPDTGFLEKAGRLFGIDPKLRREKKRLLWLTHPDELEKGTGELDQRVSGLLQRFREQILVRNHPRDNRQELYKGFSKDDNTQMWELSISFLDVEQMILMGAYSTAQMTPKLLYDLEPRIFFLCPIYRNSYADGQYEEILTAIEEFRDLYRNPEKIVLIDSLEMLENKLNEEL